MLENGLLEPAGRYDVLKLSSLSCLEVSEAFEFAVPFLRCPTRVLESGAAVALSCGLLEACDRSAGHCFKPH